MFGQNTFWKNKPHDDFESTEEDVELTSTLSKLNNESIIPRHILLRLDPELIEIAETNLSAIRTKSVVTTTNTSIPIFSSIEQLRDDVLRGSIRFNYTSPPRNLVDLEINVFKKNMEVFLLNLGFSEKDRDCILKFYSNKPKLATIKFGEKLIPLNNLQNYPNNEYEQFRNPEIITNEIQYLKPQKLFTHIYKNKDKVFLETIASQYSIKNENKTQVINDELESKDKLESLFELKENGFRFLVLRGFNLFADLINNLLRMFSLDEHKEPRNERIITRNLFSYLEPKLTNYAEITPEDGGIEQLQRDVNREFIKFKGMLPPKAWGVLSIDEFQKKMKVFLLKLQFNAENIDHIFRYYSQKPANAVNFGQRLLSIEYNQENYPSFTQINFTEPRQRVSNIFEKNTKIFFETSASGFQIRGETSQNLIATIDDKFEVLFELNVNQLKAKDNGFKLVHFKAFDFFSTLMDHFFYAISFLKREENKYSKQEVDKSFAKRIEEKHAKHEINDWIFTYCLAFNENSKVDHVSREEIKKENFDKITKALSNPDLYRKVVVALHDNGLYFQKKYEFGGGKRCGFQQLINNLTSYFKKQAYGLLMQYNNNFSDEAVHAQQRLDALKLFPGDINRLIKNGEIIPALPTDERECFSESILNLLNQLHVLSNKMEYLKSISMRKTTVSSSLKLFKESSHLDDITNPLSDLANPMRKDEKNEFSYAGLKFKLTR